jgi:hypothetical protein
VRASPQRDLANPTPCFVGERQIIRACLCHGVLSLAEIESLAVVVHG